MGIQLGSDSADQVTAVSNIFIDEYMGEANGEYVKIYLYLLRCMGSNEETVSIARMAEHFDHTEKDVRRALLYWEKVKLLRLDKDEDEQIIGITLVDTLSNVHRKRKGDRVALRKSSHAGQAARDPYDQAFSELIFYAESLFARPLTQTEGAVILGWYQDLKLPADVIEYLIGYCVDNHHKNIRYMDKVAIAWKENGIRSVNEARMESQSHSRLNQSILRAFGITGRTLAQAEEETVKKWKGEYGFSEELIIEACNRTIQVIGKPSFDYAEGILKRWRKEGVTDMEGVAALDQKHISDLTAAKKKTGMTRPAAGKYTIVSQHTYDFDAMEEEFARQLMSSQTEDS